MAEKKASERRRAREKNFVLISSALVVLTLAAFFAIDTHRRDGGFSPSQHAAPARPDKAAPSPDEAARERSAESARSTGEPERAFGGARESGTVRESSKYATSLSCSTREHPVRVALILDDAGGEGALQWEFLKLPAKLTFAVIPNLSASARFAEEARRAGHEVIIHLPMQPLASEGQILPKDMLRPGMEAREIERIVDEAIRSVPGAFGVNNHMGSLATADRALMRLLMPVLASRGLFFVDSFTHAESVAMEEAVLAGMPARRRDVFIDHVAEATYIESALRSLAEEARVRGQAIGIGHVTHAETLRVLRDTLPALPGTHSDRASGAHFVGISEVP